MRKLALILLLVIHLPVCMLNGQERYTNTEIDLKIEMEKVQVQKDIGLIQKDINQTNAKIDDFRRELDNNVQQQDEKI
jgi:hypothetical protein